MPKEKMKIARGLKAAELVLKNGRIINVLNGQIEEGDLAIEAGLIVGVGDYEGVKEIDLAGQYVCPGFIDGHVHIESSMLTPERFAQLVVTKGTTSVIADPHEIANVSGLDGIDYMLRASENLPIDVYMMLPSCVPSTDYEVAGAVLDAQALKVHMNEERVIGLGEMMNYPGVISGNEMVHEKLQLFHQRHIDGHAPGVTGKDLNAYITAGVMTDHECTTKEELLEKVGKGMYVHIREGSATRNLEALLSGVTESNARRLMFCTDDKQPMDILKEGHIDHNVRRSIELGLNPITAIQMATLNTAECYKLKKKGAIAPGYIADFLIVDDLESLHIKQVFKDGQLVAEDGEIKVAIEVFHEEKVMNTVHLDDVEGISLDLTIPGAIANVISLLPHSIITKSVIRKIDTIEGKFVHNDKLDILKLAVVERHHNTGNVGIGLVEGYGLTSGAVGLTIAHDSHNIIVIGENDDDMKLAIKELRDQQGGMVFCQHGELKATLPLEVGGLMTSQPIHEVVDRIESMNDMIRNLGVPDHVEPFLTLAFLALPVIPELKLTDKGLFDVNAFAFIDVEA